MRNNLDGHERGRRHEQHVVDLARTVGVLTPSDLADREIPRVYLTRMEQRGVLVKLGRGLYALADTDFGEHVTLVAACRAVPDGVVCLLSALRFHEMTTENPFEVWMAIAGKARRPKVAGVPLRVVRFSHTGLTLGIDALVIEHVPVRVTNPTRTVVDCFKYRNKVGLDVALAALRIHRERRFGTADDLWATAERLQVRTVIRPYLEALY
jgi:predicted transcriptional regulator of viral defense system